MLERIEYLLYYATVTIPEIGLVLFSAVTLLLCIDSFRVGRQDRAILTRNGGDSFAFRESVAQLRSAFGRGAIAAILLFFGVVAVRTAALISPTWVAVISFGLLIGVSAILGSLQILDRRDRQANIRDLLALRRARESSAAGIISIDRHSVILQFNAAAERIFGYRADEVIGTSMTALMPERFRDDHLRGIARAYTSDKPGPSMNQVLDLPGLRKDGTEAPLHITLSETTGVAGKVFQAIFTEEIPGSDKLAKGVDELRHDAYMEAIHANTAITTEARNEAHAANTANQKSAALNDEEVARTSDAAKVEMEGLREYLTMRDDRREDREDRADARSEKEQGRQNERDDTPQSTTVEAARHAETMTELVHNTALTTEARDGAQDAYHAAIQVQERIAETNRVAREASEAAGASADALREYLERKDRETERFNDADAGRAVSDLAKEGRRAAPSC